MKQFELVKHVMLNGSSGMKTAYLEYTRYRDTLARYITPPCYPVYTLKYWKELFWRNGFSTWQICVEIPRKEAEYLHLCMKYAMPLEHRCLPSELRVTLLSHPSCHRSGDYLYFKDSLVQKGRPQPDQFHHEKKHSQRPKWQTYREAMEFVRGYEIPFTEHNNGLHLIIESRWAGRIDFWPNTLRYKCGEQYFMGLEPLLKLYRTGQSGR